MVRYLFVWIFLAFASCGLSGCGEDPVVAVCAELRRCDNAAADCEAQVAKVPDPWTYAECLRSKACIDQQICVGK